MDSVDWFRLDESVAALALLAKKRIRVLDVSSGRTVRVIDAPEAFGGPIVAVRGSAGVLISYATYARVRIVDPATGLLRAELAGADEQDHIALVGAYDVDGRSLVVAHGKDIVLWDWEAGVVVSSWPAESRNQYSIVQDGDVTWLAASSYDLTELRLLDPASGEVVRTFPAAMTVGRLCTLRLPDGRTLLVCTYDKHLRFHDLASTALLGQIDYHAEVTGVCPVRTSTGWPLVAATSDRTVRLWDPVTATCVLTVPVHHRTRSCGFIDGHLIVGFDAGVVAMSLGELAAPGPALTTIHS
ncbi:hypothetical protein GCM10027614_07690 [Micromonospora vulcania]